MNLEGHQNCITGTIVTAILLNGGIFPIGQRSEASQWMVCYQRDLPHLVNRPRVAGAVFLSPL